MMVIKPHIAKQFITHTSRDILCICTDVPLPLAIQHHHYGKIYP